MSEPKIAEGPGWKVVNCDCMDPDHGMPSLAAGSIDFTCSDPPYSERTHAGQRHGRRGDKDGRQARDWASHGGLGYDHLTHAHVQVLAAEYVRVTSGWIGVMCDDELAQHWKGYDHVVSEKETDARFGDARPGQIVRMPGLGGIHPGNEKPRYVFAPVPIVIPGMNVRLAGDGPSSWAVYMIMSRPRIKRAWGTKPGAYRCTEDERRTHKVKGSKPLQVLLEIVHDYSEAGELVLDSHLGSGTAGVAAIMLGRQFLGFEANPENFEHAVERMRKTREQRILFERAIPNRSRNHYVDREDESTLELPLVDPSGDDGTAP